LNKGGSQTDSTAAGGGKGVEADVPAPPLLATLGDLTEEALTKNGGAIVKTQRSDLNPRSNRLEDLPLLLPSPVRYPRRELPCLGSITKLLARCSSGLRSICFLTSSGSLKVNRSVSSPGWTSE